MASGCHSGHAYADTTPETVPFLEHQHSLFSVAWSPNLVVEEPAARCVRRPTAHLRHPRRRGPRQLLGGCWVPAASRAGTATGRAAHRAGPAPAPPDLAVPGRRPRQASRPLPTTCRLCLSMWRSTHHGYQCRASQKHNCVDTSAVYASPISYSQQVPDWPPQEQPHSGYLKVETNPRRSASPMSASGAPSSPAMPPGKPPVLPVAWTPLLRCLAAWSLLLAGACAAPAAAAHWSWNAHAYSVLELTRVMVRCTIT